MIKMLKAKYLYTKSSYALCSNTLLQKVKKIFNNKKITSDVFIDCQ